MDMMKNPMEKPSEEKDMFDEAMGESGDKIPEMKTPEAPEEAKELITYGELMERTSERLQAVNSSLEEEREIAAEIKKMGSPLNREAAAKIKNLESKVAELFKVYDEKLSPARKEWAKAYLDREELLVEKPEAWDDMMKDIEVISEEDLEELPSEAELRAEETKLILKETEIEEEIDQLIDTMNRAPDLNRIPDLHLEEARLKVLKAELNTHIGELRKVRKSLREIRSDLNITRSAKAA